MFRVSINELKNLIRREKEKSLEELQEKPQYRAEVIDSKEAIVLRVEGEAFFETGDFIGYLTEGVMPNSLGIVIDYDRNSKILILQPYGKINLDRKSIKILEEEALISFELQEEIIRKIEKKEINSPIIPLIFHDKKLEDLSKDCELTDSRTMDKKKSLDKSQKEGVEFVLSLKNGELLIVVGPPGTGKTEFIAKSVYELYKRGEKVLIVSHTNRAIDNAIEKLPLEISLRVGRPEKVLPEISKYLLSYKARERAGEELRKIEREIEKIKNKGKGHEKSEELIELWRKRNNLLKKASEELVDEINIIGSTLIKSQLYPLKNINFDTVFIDEASISTIPLALLSLIKGKKYVIVGDHNQLLPILKTIENEDEKEKMSIFNFVKEKYENRVHWLGIHYRSNSKIIGFSKRYVYNDQISLHPSTYDKKLEIDRNKYNAIRDKRKEILDPEKPVVFVHIEGSEKRKDKSKFNEEEANICCEIYKMLQRCGIQKEDIGIITPYVAQRVKISELIKDKKGLEINTVDSFQGRQKEVIIFSIVSEGEMSFVSERHRFNVSLTRAISKLIVVGNRKAVEKSKSLIGNFLNYVYENGHIYDWERREWMKIERELYPLVKRVWKIFKEAQGNSLLNGEECKVTGFTEELSEENYIPFLFFGDYKAYKNSKIKVVTVGINPSYTEFENAKDIYKKYNWNCLLKDPENAKEECYDEYLKLLFEYFKRKKEKIHSWFNHYEEFLNNINCSYYADKDKEKNVAIHTDMCSPIATKPIWRGLSDDIKEKLMEDGIPLWHELVRVLLPDIIIISVSKNYFKKLDFKKIRDYDKVSFYTVKLNDRKDCLVIWIDQEIVSNKGVSSEEVKKSADLILKFYEENFLSKKEDKTMRKCFVMWCRDDKMEKECIEDGVFVVNKQRWNEIQKIERGDIGFLLNAGSDVLIGVFEAEGIEESKEGEELYWLKSPCKVRVKKKFDKLFRKERAWDDVFGALGIKMSRYYYEKHKYRLPEKIVFEKEYTEKILKKLMEDEYEKYFPEK